MKLFLGDLIDKNISRKVLSIFKNAQKKLIIIKKGDHSLSNTKSLNMMRSELSAIIKNIS